MLRATHSAAGLRNQRCRAKNAGSPESDPGCRSEPEFVWHTDADRVPLGRSPSFQIRSPDRTEYCGTETANRPSDADATSASDRENESGTRRNSDTAHRSACFRFDPDRRLVVDVLVIQPDRMWHKRRILFHDVLQTRGIGEFVEAVFRCRRIFCAAFERFRRLANCERPVAGGFPDPAGCHPTDFLRCASELQHDRPA